MKAKLIKREKGYILIDINKSNEDRWSVIGSYPSNKDVEKLSLKNCKLIEDGYDLEDLAEKKWSELSKNLNLSIQDKALWCGGFQNGVIEILKDKKFNEENLRQAYMDGANNIDCYGNPTIKQDEDFKNTINSLQKNEWEVKIEMELNINVNEECTESHTEMKYKLDENGRLILRKI